MQFGQDLIGGIESLKYSKNTAIFLRIGWTATSLLRCMLVGVNPCHVFGQFCRGSCLPSGSISVYRKTVKPQRKSNPNHIFPSDVVLGQLVTERIGLENGIVLLFSSKPMQGVRRCPSRLVLGTNTLSPTEVGALSVVVHPDDGLCLSFYPFGLALLLVRQPTAVYYSSLNIPLPCRW